MNYLQLGASIGRGTGDRANEWRQTIHNSPWDTSTVVRTGQGPFGWNHLKLTLNFIPNGPPCFCTTFDCRGRMRGLSERVLVAPIHAWFCFTMILQHSPHDRMMHRLSTTCDKGLCTINPWYDVRRSNVRLLDMIRLGLYSFNELFLDPLTTDRPQSSLQPLTPQRSKSDKHDDDRTSFR